MQCRHLNVYNFMLEFWVLLRVSCAQWGMEADLSPHRPGSGSEAHAGLPGPPTPRPPAPTHLRSTQHRHGSSEVTGVTLSACRALPGCQKPWGIQKAQAVRSPIMARLPARASVAAGMPRHLAPTSALQRVLTPTVPPLPGTAWRPGYTLSPASLSDRPSPELSSASEPNR